MVSIAVIPSRSRWVLVLCVAAVLLGLAAHLAADAVSRSPDLVQVRQHCTGASALARRQVVLCGLLAGLVLPETTIISTWLTVVLVLTSGSLIESFWSSSPLVHPPILLD
jgi:hypothetical protein